MPGWPATPPAADPLPGPRLALVVATATYTADPGLRQLRAPARDADDLAQVLADPNIGGFMVTTVIDQPAQQVRLAVEDFLDGRGTGDLLLVYLSCHGLLDARRRLYFAATDTRKDRLGSTGVEAAWVLDQLEHCRARRQVLILDSCFSGAFAHGAKGEADLGLRDRFLGQGRGRVVLTASAATEYSFEGDPTDAASPVGSVFTAALVQGLRTGAADTDHDGLVSVDDAYAYVFDQVQAAGAAQTPQRWLYGAEGRILLARSPAGPTGIPAPLPESLRAGLRARWRRQGVTAESWRVAQVVADRGPGDAGWRGSGYLVAPGLVLTAAHVVAGASVVRVRLDVGQRTEVDVQADSWWADSKADNGTDLAVIMIPADATAGRDVERVRFGRISDCTAVLAVQALGFPRFKLRARSERKGDQGVFRDLEQVTGHVPVAANRRQGTLSVYLDDPLPTSPWDGMSGAAVWATDRIIAVVAEHHSGEGAARLTARRIDRVYEQLPESELDRLVTWLGLAPAAGQLADVVPPEPGQLLRSAYLEQVHDLAPDALLGRDSELAQWAEFCAGTDPYTWWQAGPGQARARWRPGSLPIPLPVWTSSRSSSPAACMVRPTATPSWMP